MTFTTLLGLSGVSILLCAIVFRLLLFLKLKRAISYSVSLLVFMLTFIPLSYFSLNEYVRGVINDPSITTLILLILYLFKPDREQSENQPVLYAAALCGLIFYPAALGLGPLDPYAGGYINNAHGLLASLVFLCVLATLMIIAFIKNYLTLLICLIASTLAFQLNLMESNNLWDYLLDPLIFFYALFALVSRNMTKIFMKKKEHA